MKERVLMTEGEQECEEKVMTRVKQVNIKKRNPPPQTATLDMWADEGHKRKKLLDLYTLYSTKYTVLTSQYNYIAFR